MVGVTGGEVPGVVPTGDFAVSRGVVGTGDGGSVVGVGVSVIVGSPGGTGFGGREVGAAGTVLGAEVLAARQRGRASPSAEQIITVPSAVFPYLPVSAFAHHAPGRTTPPTVSRRAAVVRRPGVVTCRRAVVGTATIRAGAPVAPRLVAKVATEVGSTAT